MHGLFINGVNEDKDVSINRLWVGLHQQLSKYSRFLSNNSRQKSDRFPGEAQNGAHQFQIYYPKYSRFLPEMVGKNQALLCPKLMDPNIFGHDPIIYGP